MSNPAESEVLLKPDDEGLEGNRLLASRRWITIEPVIFTCLVAYGTIQTLRIEYVRMLTADEYGANGTGSEQNCSVNSSSPEYRLEQRIQSETSLRNTYLVLCSAGLNILSAPLLSAWSDKVGRKLVLFVASLGMWGTCGVYLLVTALELPYYYLFIGELLQGLSGSQVLIIAASLAYIADITTKEKRLVRFVIIDTTLFFGIAVSQVAMGYVVHSYGFVAPFAAMVLACGLALLYIVIPKLLLETRDSHGGGASVTSVFKQISELCHSIVDLLRVKEENRHIILSLLIMIGFSFTLMFQGAIGTSALLGMGAPICWTTVTVGIFTAVTLFGGCLGLLIAGMTLPRCLKEYWILYLSSLSSIACYTMTGFADTSLFLFLGSVVGSIRNLPGPIVRAMLSKAVSVDEQGVVFAVVGVIESVAGFASPLLLGSLYASTVQIYPGLAFFVLAGMNVIPITLILILHITLVGMAKKKKKPAPIQVRRPPASLPTSTDDSSGIDVHHQSQSDGLRNRDV